MRTLIALASLLLFSQSLLASEINFCDRDPNLVAVVSQKLQKACSDITPEDLLTITAISLPPKSPYIKPRQGDFDGFDNLITLRVSLKESGQGRPLPTELFTNLNKLEALQISGMTNAEIPPRFFIGLSSLKALELIESSITRLETDQFADVPHLIHLSLARSDEEMTIANYAFRGLSKLQGLNFENTGKIHLAPAAFHGLEQLRVLFFQHSGVQGLHPESFRGLKNVERIVITGDYREITTLGELPDDLFSGLTNLREIFMPRAGITKVPRNLFRGAKFAPGGGITLTHNEITEIPHSLFVPLLDSQIRFVNISTNPISYLNPESFSPASFPESANLWITYLPLSADNLSELREVLGERLWHVDEGTVR